MRELYHPARGDIELPSVFYALSDPIRLQIVVSLADGSETKCSYFQMLHGVPIAKSTLSHHLKVLREAGLTRSRVEGKNIFVSLRREDLEARFPGLLSSILASAHRSTAMKAETLHRLSQSVAPAIE